MQGKSIRLVAVKNSDTSWPAAQSIAARIVGGLFRSRNHVWDNDHKIVATYGMTWSEFGTLISLRSAGADFTLSPTKLYSDTQTSSGGMTKMLHHLEAAKLIERIPNPEDRRSRLVKLTPKGAEMVETVVERLVETNNDLFLSVLGDEDAEELARLLRKLAQGLQKRQIGGP